MRNNRDSASSSVPLLGAIFLLLLAAAGGYLLLVGQAALKGYFLDLPMAEARERVSKDLVSLTLAQLGGMGTALVIGLSMFAPEQSVREALRIKPTRSTTLALCLLAGACLQFPLSELSNLLHAFVVGPESMEQQLAVQNMLEAPSLLRGLVVVCCVVAAVPVMEELLFRGLFAFGIAERSGRAVGIIASSCLFGLAHLNAASVIYATIAGVVLSAIALHAQSIWPSICVHAAINAMPVLLPERVLPITGFNVPSATPTHLPPVLALGGLLLGALFLAFAHRIEYAAEP